MLQFSLILRQMAPHITNTHRDMLFHLQSIFNNVGVGGNCVCQENLSGGTHFPRKFCPIGQDILSIPGQIVRIWF